MNLFTSTGAITLSLSVPPPTAGEEIDSVAAVFGHISDAGSATSNAGVPLLPFVVGTTEPGPDERTRPWMRFDDQGRFLGVQHYNPLAAAWVRAGAPGELLSLIRTERTVALDMAAKGLTGSWAVADEAPFDLSAETALFSGSAPNYTRYTVRRL